MADQYADNNNSNGPKTLQICRPVYDQEQINTELEYYKQKKKGLKQIVPNISECKFKNCIFNFIPILKWMQTYSFKSDLIGDFITGCTVAVMHIPQGMGYALLGNLPPIVGIYTAFFPVILYSIFGTSKHISMGTFAVVCIMVGKIVEKYAQEDLSEFYKIGNLSVPTNGNVIDDSTVTSSSHTITAIEVSSAVCLVVGLIQILMYIFRLGIITSLLSESLVSGFTTGAAIHVLISQIKEILGISVKTESKYFEIIYTLSGIFKDISIINWIAVSLSIVTMILLIINNEILKPYFSKKCSFPIPAELILVLGGTLVSKFLYLKEEHHLKTLNNIPTGFPNFSIPQFSLIQQVAIDSIPAAMVAYTISISMALIFAQKLNYEVNSNQELFAMGISNVFGSFFSCLPFSASLSRSIIQQSVGGKTQIASLISCCWLAVILLWIGPFFEPLPRCVLAGIIIVSLKGMLWQIQHFFKFWKLDRLDAFVWLFTFLFVILISIDIGLLVGIVLSVLCIFFKSLKPYVCLLGNVPGTEIYLDIKRFKAAEEIPNVKIFHYCGSISFATRTMFKNELYELLKIDFKKGNKKTETKSNCNKLSFEYLILDFSAVSYIDPSGIETLKIIVKEFSTFDVKIYIAGASCPTYELMKKCGLHLTSEFLKFVPTLQDAVYHGQKFVPLTTVSCISCT